MTNVICPICGRSLARSQTCTVGGWEVCARHKVYIKPSQYASRCAECMGPIFPGEEIVLSKDGAGYRWVALHRRDRCDGTVQTGSNPSSDAWAVLYLIPGAPSEVVKAAYRALSQKYHPDRGGDEAKMQELNTAVAELLK